MLLPRFHSTTTPSGPLQLRALQRRLKVTRHWVHFPPRQSPVSPTPLQPPTIRVSLHLNQPLPRLAYPSVPVPVVQVQRGVVWQVDERAPPPLQHQRLQSLTSEDSGPTRLPALHLKLQPILRRRMRRGGWRRCMAVVPRRMLLLLLLRLRVNLRLPKVLNTRALRMRRGDWRGNRGISFWVLGVGHRDHLEMGVVKDPRLHILECLKISRKVPLKRLFERLRLIYMSLRKLACWNLIDFGLDCSQGPGFPPQWHPGTTSHRRPS